MVPQVLPSKTRLHTDCSLAAFLLNHHSTSRLLCSLTTITIYCFSNKNSYIRRPPDPSLYQTAPSHGLFFPTENNLNLTSFLPHYEIIYHPTCIFLESSSISWKPKKQSTIRYSSSEVEYRSFASLTCELWCTYLLYISIYPIPLLL